MLRFLRTLPGCEHTRVVKVQTETGVRETYRIDGLYQVTQSDYVSGKVFEDAISYAYYPIDIHDENGVQPEHLSENVVDNGYGRTVGANGEHLKLTLIQEENPFKVFPAIAFHQGHQFKHINKGNPFDICYQLVENDFRGRVNIQIQISDMKYD